MAILKRLNGTLCENVLTLLCYSEEHGRIVANSVETELFEGDFKIIAEKSVDYWRKYGIPPREHTADLVSKELEDPKSSQTFRRILLLLHEMADSVNTKYVMDELNTFTRMQRLKDAIVKSAESINARQEMAIEEIETIWNDILRAREKDYHLGMKLTEIHRMLKYFEENEQEFKTGIEELDIRNVNPSRGKVMLLLAPPGKGKSWFLVNAAKQALMLRKRVLYISLEMSEEEIAQRLYQSIFSAPTRHYDDEVTIREMDFEKDRLVGFHTETIIPDFTLDSPTVREELESRVMSSVSQFENLQIIRFSPRSVNINDIESYLDNLEIIEHFIPDLVILDYIGRIKTNLKEHRLSLGNEFELFRGLMIKRNMAGLTAHQVSRAGAKAHEVRVIHAAEDWSLIMTSDIAVTYSCTEAEFEVGLARLYVEKARSERDHFSVLITQNYTLGQFCLNSTMMTRKYRDLLKEITGEKDDDESQEDEDGEN